MSQKLEPLSIEEAGYGSHYMTGRLRSEDYKKIDFIFSDDKNLVINYNGQPIAAALDVDLDSLIQYLQEVKIWQSEEEMVRKLLGQK